MKRNKLYPYFFVFLFLLSACAGFSEAGKVLRNEKSEATDEFLIKKNEPLTQPPDYKILPTPDSMASNKKNEKNIKKILKAGENDQIKIDGQSSVEDSIVNQIRK
tara:strand:- start:4878 stop:5192 length:315 start_codon:yes stop_codon:yes gene_type:complete